MPTMFDHRISRAITALTDRFESLSSEQQVKFAENANLDAGDLLSLGEIPTRGLMANRLTADEAQALYAIHSGWADATAVERMVFILTTGELLG